MMATVLRATMPAGSTAIRKSNQLKNCSKIEVRRRRKLSAILPIKRDARVGCRFALACGRGIAIVGPQCRRGSVGAAAITYGNDALGGPAGSFDDLTAYRDEYGLGTADNRYPLEVHNVTITIQHNSNIYSRNGQSQLVRRRHGNLAIFLICGAPLWSKARANVGAPNAASNPSLSYPQNSTATFAMAPLVTFNGNSASIVTFQVPNCEGTALITSGWHSVNYVAPNARTGAACALALSIIVTDLKGTSRGTSP